MAAEPISMPRRGAPAASGDQTAPELSRRNKPRHFDLYPDEFLSGVDGMPPDEIGIYMLVCCKIYSRGDAIPDDDGENARIFRVDPRTWKRIKGALITKGKLQQEGGRLANRRCMIELAKARKRIDDAQKNGAQGGRPGGTSDEDRAEDSPMVAPTVAEPSANRSPTVDGKSPPVSNEISDLAKAAGSFGGNLTTNHQPPTTKEEEAPPTRNGENYAFFGKIVRLTQRDFSQWQKSYHAIPDLCAFLQAEDDYYDGALKDEERKLWIHRVSKKAQKAHNEALRQKAGGRRGIGDSF
jgi:uncharacterized protein YdaU (DUF1376 family)